MAKTKTELLETRAARPFGPAVSVTGMGIISSLGQGTANFKQALLDGRIGVRKSQRFSELSFSLIAAEINNFDFKQALSAYSSSSENLMVAAQKVGQRAPFSIQLSLIAALEAWQQARLHKRSIEKERVGLVVAGNNTTQGYGYHMLKNLHEELSYLPPTYALQFMDTNQVGVLSDVFSIHGEGFTIGGASASGNVGIIHGCRLIQQGIVDICMVVGAMADLSPVELQGFYNIGALGGRGCFQERPETASRPFDKAHHGFIWGQASACLILESSVTGGREAEASLGKIRGAAMTLDGNRSPNPSQSGEENVMRQALASAQMGLEEIDYINTHGSSSPLGDKTEVAAIRGVFGKNIEKSWLNSTKALTGHCLWSAGVVEAVATLLQMQGGFIHANPNLDDPIDTTCRFSGKEKETALINAAMSNSFGFGGINSSLIFTRGEK